MKFKPQYCQVQDALSILVGKWKPIILLHLMSEGTMRYGETKKALVGITPKMLTSQLRELEEEGLISRKLYPEVPPKVEYSITEYGMTLEPILVAMHDWGTKHVIRKSEM
ncbi:winged helix-turn-helix transcriptional regulator [Paenibacillus solisilvae]|uniref:Winged helix-turn-helix transcriptional regulator n=1 Tax=Paenibacillus solisilvae TaxID=2486751 RepID=A0ABW0W1I5_9BACL